MVILYLFLGHFIADFLLQPHYLVVWKNKSWHGVLVHVIIHFLVTSLLLHWYLGSQIAFILAFIISFVHFWIDLLKANHQKGGAHPVMVYWFDQILHYLSILTIGFIYLFNFSNSLITKNDWLNNLYRSPMVIIYFSGAIFATFTIEYSLFRHKQTDSKVTQINHKNIIKRLFLFTLIFIGFAFATPLAGFTV